MGIIRYKIILGEYLRGLKRIMKCKKCKADIPDELHPVYCCYCGEKLQRERKKKGEIKIPTPRKRGQKWYVDLRREGVTVIEDTEAAAIAKAQAIRAGFVPVKKKAADVTLETAIDNYIAVRQNVLSPSTVVGYKSVKKNRFKNYMDMPIADIPDWQTVINSEALVCSPKTLKNAWGLVAPAIKAAGVDLPKLTFPQIVPKDPVFLTPDQIKIFVSAIKGTPVEIPALLGLHSLRRSEIAALDWSNVDLKKKTIKVSGAVVPGENWTLVEKPTNKNNSSTRIIPIMIPELYDALNAVKDKQGKVVTCYISTVYDWVNDVCDKNNLPRLGVHGLRHSYASLAYHVQMPEQAAMQIGGWSDYGTMRKIYTHLSALDISQAENKMSEFYQQRTD